MLKNDDYDVISNFMGFSAMMGLLSGKIGLYLIEESEFRVID